MRACLLSVESNLIKKLWRYDNGCLIPHEVTWSLGHQKMFVWRWKKSSLIKSHKHSSHRWHSFLTSSSHKVLSHLLSHSLTLSLIYPLTPSPIPSHLLSLPNWIISIMKMVLCLLVASFFIIKIFLAYNDRFLSMIWHRYDRLLWLEKQKVYYIYVFKVFILIITVSMNLCFHIWVT
jgi:hypothetical protein